MTKPVRDSALIARAASIEGNTDAKTMPPLASKASRSSGAQPPTHSKYRSRTPTNTFARPFGEMLVARFFLHSVNRSVAGKSNGITRLGGLPSVVGAVTVLNFPDQRWSVWAKLEFAAFRTSDCRSILVTQSRFFFVRVESPLWSIMPSRLSHTSGVPWIPEPRFPHQR